MVLCAAQTVMEIATLTQQYLPSVLEEALIPTALWLVLLSYLCIIKETNYSTNRITVFCAFSIRTFSGQQQHT